MASFLFQIGEYCGPRRFVSALMVIATLLGCPASSYAFSVLAHQALVDQSWRKTLVPLIRQRFPNATDQDLTDALANARGGSHLPDLGYFPFGSHLFTDLLHYVRTGDFVSRLMTEAGSAKEYAFALGVLAHFDADTIGHPLATNLAVPIIYPDLAEKYGNSVTYAQGSSQHLQTEFRFDVLQVAHRGEVPDLFQHSLEFQVPREFLDRVLQENYGVGLNDLFDNYDVALLTYRWGFRALINETTGISWRLYQGDIQTLEPGITHADFLHAMPRADFEQQFGKAFLEPGYFVRFVGFVGNLLPNIGPLARLPYKPLPENVRQLYFGAFHKASEQYTRDLTESAKNQPRFQNLILDTGTPDRPGSYPPADKAYAELLRLHAKDHFARMPKPLADDMLRHFRDRNTALADVDDADEREETLNALTELEAKQGGSQH